MMKFFSLHQKFQCSLLLILLNGIAVLLYILNRQLISIVSDSAFWDIEEIKTFAPEVTLPSIYRKNTSHKDIDAEFTLTPATSLLLQKKHVITLFVKSHARHFVRREVIRKSWASYSKIDKFTVMVIFYVGTTKIPEVNEGVRGESECYGDILRMNAYESFQNLTLKTLSSFHWITKNIKNPNSFYIFTDDDCVINWQHTVAFLIDKVKFAHKKLIYCGFQYEEGSQPIRGNSRLSVPWRLYPEKYFPSFCRGVMIILTYSMIESLYEASTVTYYDNFPLEDVMIYGILRYKLHLPQEHIAPVCNGGRNLVFYPWDNSLSATDKMLRKWRRLLHELRSNCILTKRGLFSQECDQYNKLKMLHFENLVM